jgi:hypothetical protein
LPPPAICNELPLSKTGGKIRQKDRKDDHPFGTTTETGNLSDLSDLSTRGVHEGLKGYGVVRAGSEKLPVSIRAWPSIVYLLF